jgi:hypothetical protein
MANKKIKTAKIKVTWNFELPVDKAELKDPDLLRNLIIQDVFDELVNYAICKHLEDACDYCFKVLSDPKDEIEKKKNSVYKSLWKNHEYWAKLLRTAKPHYEVTF